MFYRGKGEHSVNDLEQMIEEQVELNYKKTLEMQKLEPLAEEYECAMMYLDKKDVPNFDVMNDSEKFSLVGRIEWFVKNYAMQVTRSANDELRFLNRELDQQRFNNKHNLSIDQKISDKIEQQSETIEGAIRALDDAHTMITHAIELEYLGEGSTLGMANDTVTHIETYFRQIGREPSAGFKNE